MEYKEYDTSGKSLEEKVYKLKNEIVANIIEVNNKYCEKNAIRQMICIEIMVFLCVKA